MQTTREAKLLKDSSQTVAPQALEGMQQHIQQPRLILQLHDCTYAHKHRQCCA